MESNLFINKLAMRLSEPLPGWHSQKELMPKSRKRFELPDLDRLHPASVLIALFPQNNEWFFPLIKRTEDGFSHSGQIALPGGRKEGNETDAETALREAKEEVNIDPDAVKILGTTSPLPIPVSMHLVQPFVGVLSSVPDFRPDPREVDDIFTVPINDLTRTDIQYEQWEFKSGVASVPFFEIQGNQIWGATAMMLSEFRELLNQIS